MENKTKEEMIDESLKISALLKEMRFNCLGSSLTNHENIMIEILNLQLQGAESYIFMMEQIEEAQKRIDRYSIKKSVAEERYLMFKDSFNKSYSEKELEDVLLKIKVELHTLEKENNLSEVVERITPSGNAVKE